MAGKQHTFNGGGVGGGGDSSSGSPPQSCINVGSSGKFLHQRTKSSSGERSDGGGGGGGGGGVYGCHGTVERVRRFSVFTVPQSVEGTHAEGSGVGGGGGGGHHHHHHRESSHDHGKTKDSDGGIEEEKAVERVVSPDGRYIKLRDEIGRGSFKTVYKGLDAETGVAVAWCELLDRGWSAEDRQKYREEVEMLKALHHPNILQFYESWSYSNGSYKNTVLVTELMSGTLKSYIRLFQKVSRPVLVSWCHQILCGLYFLHTRTPPIIHRDLKCDNIFVIDITGVVKIGDLGLAKLKSSAFVKSVIGTPEFMAPEMYEENYDEAVDVYAFGMCMLEMATCEYPYKECTNAMQIIKKVSNGVKPESLERIENPEVREIVMECIQVDKSKRATVAELLSRPFFIPEKDMTVELEPSNLLDETPSASGRVITLSMKFGARKRRGAHNRNEAVHFDFRLNKDSEDSVVQDMMNSGLLYEEDMESAKALIKEQVQRVLKSRALEFAPTDEVDEVNYEGAEELRFKHALETAILKEHQRAEVESLIEEHTHSSESGGCDAGGAGRSEVLSCHCLVSRCQEHSAWTFGGWSPMAGYRHEGHHADACAAAVASARAVQKALQGGVAECDGSLATDVAEFPLIRAASTSSAQLADQTVTYVKWFLRSGRPYQAASATPGQSHGASAAAGAAAGQQSSNDMVSRIVRSMISVNDEHTDEAACRGGAPQSCDGFVPRAYRERQSSFNSSYSRARPNVLDLDVHRLAIDRCPSPCSPSEQRVPGKSGGGDHDKDDFSRLAKSPSGRATPQALARKLIVQKALQESLQQMQSTVRQKMSR